MREIVAALCDLALFDVIFSRVRTADGPARHLAGPRGLAPDRAQSACRSPARAWRASPLASAGIARRTCSRRSHRFPTSTDENRPGRTVRAPDRDANWHAMPRRPG